MLSSAPPQVGPQAGPQAGLEAGPEALHLAPSPQLPEPSAHTPPAAQPTAQTAAPPAAPAHQPGVSAFPAARVTKIIKADADVDNVNKEAVFAISMATVRIH